MSTRVVEIDSSRHLLTLSNGQTVRYSVLIIPRLSSGLPRELGEESISTQTNRLKSSTVHVIGIGLRGKPPESLEKKCWMYFPGKDSNFYRVTIF